jgi:hypothetical protein
MQEIKVDLALIKKDLENAVNLARTISDLTEKTTKLKYDVDNYFARVREVERKYEEARN